jgi:small subunit ribosomal protein S16
MLTIRLTRKGKKNQPFFRVVVIDKRRTANGGRAVEDLGYVDPLTKKRSFNKERILYWISKGAQPSASIHNLLVSEKIIEGIKVKITNISKKKQAEIAAAKKAAEAPAPAATPVPAEAPAVTPTPEEKPAV